MDEHEASSSANPQVHEHSQEQQHPQEQQQQLPTSLQLHILSLLPPNDRALSGRFACRDAADALSGPQHCNASLSQPLPPHAVTWAQEAGQQHVRQLPFLHKFHLLCTAARSGSEANLEVAWALLEPSVFPELLQHVPDTYNPYPDPGVAAVRAGHVRLLGWLLRRCPGLIQPEQVLAAAAQHRPLAGLQQAWETLRGHCKNGSGVSSSSVGGSRSRDVHLIQAVLDAAAKSRTPDAVAKMEWLLAEGAGSCLLRDSTTGAAACSGDLGRLRWLRDRGCPFGGYALCAALLHAGLSVAQWLVGEGLCELPPRAAEGEDSSNNWRWDIFLHAAANATDGAAKLEWLQQQGAPSSTRLAKDLALFAARSGRVEVVQYLLSVLCPAAFLSDPSDQDTVGEAAVESGSIEMVEYLVQEAGLVLSHKAYHWAASTGRFAMVRWLALEAGVPFAGCNLSVMLIKWPCGTQADSRAQLEAVQLLVGAGCTYDEEDAVGVAARRGNLALVQYLHRQQPGQLPVGRCEEAASGGCEALLEWVAGQPGGRASVGRSPYHGAARQGDRATLAALRRLGVPWRQSNLLVWTVTEWRCEVPVLRWLAEQGAPVGDKRALREAVEKAVQSRRLDGDRAAELRSWAAEVGATAED